MCLSLKSRSHQRTSVWGKEEGRYEGHAALWKGMVSQQKRRRHGFSMSGSWVLITATFHWASQMNPVLPLFPIRINKELKLISKGAIKHFCGWQSLHFYTSLVVPSLCLVSTNECQHFTQENSFFFFFVTSYTYYYLDMLEISGDIQISNTKIYQETWHLPTYWPLPWSIYRI